VVDRPAHLIHDLPPRISSAATSTSPEHREPVPSVPLLPDDAPPVRAVAERGGPIKNLYRSLANQPTLLKAWTDFAWTLRFESTTPRPLRELLILRAAHLTGSSYLWADHVFFGRDSGLTDERIEALKQWRESDRFTVSERAALELADQLITTGRVSEE